MSQTSHTPHTPMIRQYLEIKNQYPDSILFYRIGDFYEMFFDDAIRASKILDIVLTTRNKNDPDPIPLCGIPYHSMQPYLEKLVMSGLKVAICDQVEDPKTAQGVVKRDVTRVVTPGLTDFAQKSHYLASIFLGEKFWGLSFLDGATGDFRVSQISADPSRLEEALCRFQPQELLIPEGIDLKNVAVNFKGCVTRLPAWVWEEATARKNLHEQFGVATLAGFGCDDMSDGIVAAGAALHYAKETQRVLKIPHLTSLKRDEENSVMFLGEETRKNLNLEELIALLDRTKTAMGRRCLADWFGAPLVKKDLIEKRLDAVAELKDKINLLTPLQKKLGDVYDLERINSRLSFGTCNARDLRALAGSLSVLATIQPILQEFQSEELKKIAQSWNIFENLCKTLEKSLVEDPPLTIREGGVIREGMDASLDELRHLQRDAKGAIAAIEERERQRTGIGSLKVRFNHVFGYYLEVTATHLAKVPVDYIRKQTLANAERYITPELKEFEDKILGAEEKIKALEFELFCQLRAQALLEVADLQQQARRVAELDTYLSLAEYARENQTVRPTIEDSGRLIIKEGRHPLVEKNIPSGSYVPTDLTVASGGDRLLMITGPNMAGKSTVIRQAGVLVLMAQVGSFVPAREATIGIVDKLFTRVGASDRLARGESTFMVEMCETAAILHRATSRSFILLDEIGRGTSTFDGISIAWAVAEYLHDQVGARTLFATHYHELIDLARTRPGIKNYNVAVKQEGEEIVFLYRLISGGMSHSYGIHVARLAGLPVSVLERAKEVLQNLEQGELDPTGTPRLGKHSLHDENQGTLF